MRKKNFKGRCEKRMIEKCGEVCKTYDAIQYAYADLLQANNGIQEIRCNVLLDGLDAGEYTSDFVCVKSQPYGLTTGSAGGLDEPLRGIFRYRL
ncbi:hypothetical protein C804_03876 [Lachnospiraceae bacterium A4]|nr:hypothetical protein C804_03876 [Lachnospiraceae bacterium A4]